MIKKPILIAAALTLVLGTGGATAAMATSTDGTNQPSADGNYLNDDGTVDISKVPEDAMMMVDEQGEIIMDKDGQPILLDQTLMYDSQDDPFEGLYPAPKNVRLGVDEDGSKFEEADAAVLSREDTIRAFQYRR